MSTLVDAVASELYRVFGSNDHLDECGRMQPFNCLWPYDKDMWRRYGQEVIAAIEPELRKRHRAELYEELIAMIRSEATDTVWLSDAETMVDRLEQRARQEAETDE